MGKKRLLQLGILLIGFMALIVSAQAAEKETVSLTLKDNQVEAVLELPEEPKENVVSLQLSFCIRGDGGGLKADEVDFAFDAGLPQGAVQQCRYQEDTGILSIYISGKENLYKSQNITLGRVVVKSDRSASVSVEKNSFKTVNDAFGMYQGEVNTGEDGVPINDNPAGEGSESGGNTGTGGESGGSSQGGSNPEDGLVKDSGENGVAIKTTGNNPAGGNKNGGEKEKESPGTGTVSGMMDKLMNPDGQGSGAWDTRGGQDDALKDGADPAGSFQTGDTEGPGEEKAGLRAGEILPKVLLGLAAVTAAGAAAVGGRVAYVALRRQRRRRRRMQTRRNRQHAQNAKTAAKGAPGIKSGRTAAESVRRTRPKRPMPESARRTRPERPMPESTRRMRPERPMPESTRRMRPERPMPESTRRTRPERPMPESARRMRPAGTDAQSTRVRRAQNPGPVPQTAWRQEKPYVRKKRKIG